MGGQWASLILTVLTTGFVLLLAWGVLWLLNRFQPGKSRRGGMEFVSSLAVGGRERVTLVRYRGEIFMLGVTAGSISLLARAEAEEDVDAFEELTVKSSG